MNKGWIATLRALGLCVRCLLPIKSNVNVSVYCSCLQRTVEIKPTVEETSPTVASVIRTCLWCDQPHNSTEVSDRYHFECRKHILQIETSNSADGL